MDLPAANPDRVKQQLGAMNLTPEDWGGNVICCPVSATTGQGINDLLEMILLQADMLELKANPKARARGYVIEARLEAGMGPVANLLVVNGMLSVGDAVLCSQYWGRVRALINDHGVKVKSAGPATPIQCLGLSGVPSAGAEFRVLLNERAARSLAEERAAQIKLEQVSVPKRVSLDNLYQKLKESERLELKLIVKADTQGSLEAIEHALREIKSDKVSLSILLGGVGNITANDVLLAKASEAVILGFHVAKDADVSGMAKREGVDIRLHSIIYELLDEVRDAMAGMLAPLIREKILGHLEIKQVFAISKGGKAAGCVVKDGRVTSRANARVVRGGDVIYNGSIVSLRRFQNDVSEVAQGQECGLRLDNFTEFAAEDTIEAYETEKIPQKL
jgi:translation initiation factor IF-2